LVSFVAECYNARLLLKGAWVPIQQVSKQFLEMMDIEMDSDVDIGTLPISELQFSV
jgi:hypothetical protein